MSENKKKKTPIWVYFYAIPGMIYWLISSFTFITQYGFSEYAGGGYWTSAIHGLFWPIYLLIQLLS